MTQHPQYPSPQPLGYATPPAGPVVDLRAIATRQRAIMLCILAYLALVLAQFGLPPSLSLVVGLVALAISITAAVFVFMLALSLYSIGVGVVLGILTLIPLVGLIVLLVINGKATAVLRKHGLKVGLLGANPNQIPPGGYGAPPPMPPR